MNSPLRIALIGDFPLNFENAPGSRYLWLAKALAEKGRDVVVGGEAGGAAPDGIRTVTVPPFRSGGMVGRFIAPHLAALRLLWKRELRSADVLWVRGLLVAVLFGLYGRLTGKRVMLDFHGFLSTELWADRGHPARRAMAWYAWLWERVSLRLIHGAVVAGEGHLRLFRKQVPDGTVWNVPNGISPERFAARKVRAGGEALKQTAGIKPTAPVVIFVGRNNAYWWTGAFDAVARKLPPAKMLVLGDGYAAGDPNSEGPLYAGHMSNEKVAEWLCQGADVAVCPYRHDWVNANTPNFLNSARKLLEYAAAGLPIVLPDIPARPGFLVPEEHCLLYRPGDADDLTAQVQRLLADAPLRKKMGAAGRKLAKQFEWGQLLDDSGLVEWLQGGA